MQNENTYLSIGQAAKSTRRFGCHPASMGKTREFGVEF